MTNVAAGTQATDAVNKAQLDAVAGAAATTSRFFQASGNGGDVAGALVDGDNALAAGDAANAIGNGATALGSGANAWPAMRRHWASTPWPAPLTPARSVQMHRRPLNTQPRRVRKARPVASAEVGAASIASGAGSTATGVLSEPARGGGSGVLQQCQWQRRHRGRQRECRQWHRVGSVRHRCRGDRRHSTAIGGYAQASAFNATAFGNFANASGSNSVALGGDSEASGAYSTATGQGSLATGTNSVAVGGSLFGVLATEASGIGQPPSVAAPGPVASTAPRWATPPNRALPTAWRWVPIRSPTATTPCRSAAVATPARSPTWLMARRAMMRSTRASSTP